MNQDNDLARALRHTIEFADKEIAIEKDELKKSRMIQARNSLIEELKIIKERL